jgi:hypothetical protein
MGVLFLFTNLHAQKRMILTPDKAVIFGELGTVVMFEKDLRIALDVNPERIDEAYKEVDLKEGDLILFANGKKVETINELKEIYEGTEPGKEVKLGIQRGDNRSIVSFVRSDKVAPGFKIQRKEGDEQ